MMSEINASLMIEFAFILITVILHVDIVESAAIYYAYWAEVGVKDESSNEVDDNEDLAGDGQFAGAANTSSKVKKNIKDEKKWTEIFKGWTWPKEDIKASSEASTPPTTSITNIND